MKNKKSKLSILKHFFESGQKGIFLYTGRKDKNNKKSYLFINPVKTLRGRTGKVLEEAQKWIDRGYMIAGHASYGAMSPKFKIQHSRAVFGVYKKPIMFDRPDPDMIINGGKNRFWIKNLKPDTDYKEYKKNFNRIKRDIINGETYQINYTFKYNFGINGSRPALFADLLKNQRVPYAAYINDGLKTVISLSPEMFFTVNRGSIFMKPMKGTVVKSAECGVRNTEKRTRNTAERILKNAKNKAENIMIVDMIRNDLGRICRTGSVSVPARFSVEEYGTVFQMTSTVKGRLKPGMGVELIFKAVFPSGSVTGAPKIRSMEIIKEVEKGNRGLYTGAVGFAAKNKAVFNIPIRTAVISKNNTGEIGTGSGIVYDSEAEKEYKESTGKINFLKAASEEYCIFESIHLLNGKYTLLGLHFKRMAKSAKALGVPFRKNRAIIELGRMRKRLHKKGRFKIRLLLSGSGIFRAEAVPIRESGSRPVRLAISSRRVDPGNIFLYYKTTNRAFYDAEFLKCRKKGYGDVIFLNSEERLTEAHSSNIFIEKNGIFYTPPVSEGLLPGTYREYLLKTWPEKYRVKRLRLKDLESADAVYLANSVRGMRKAVLKF